MDWKEYYCTAEWDSEGAIAYRPLIDVLFSHEGKSVTIFSLVDSGAEELMLPAEMAAPLGIDLRACPKKSVGGIGGFKEGCIGEVTMQVSGFDDVISARAVFIDGLGGTALLGQKFFFENFYVRFERDNKLFAIARSPKKLTLS